MCVFEVEEQQGMLKKRLVNSLLLDEDRTLLAVA